MTDLTHADAHERLADLLLEPAALERLVRELAAPVPGAEDRGAGDRGAGDRGAGDRGANPLAAHLAVCPICREEVVAWDRLHGTVQAALVGADGPAAGGAAAVDHLADLAAEQRISAPAELRSSVRDLVRASRSPMGVQADPVRSVSRRWAMPLRVATTRPARRLLPLVAVLAIAVLAGGTLLNQGARLDRSRAETAALETVTATLDRVLRDPTHRVVELRDAVGVAQGSISWSRQDLVVLTDALQPPGPGQLYRCWIERGGVRYPVGQMWFAGGTAYWTGSVDAWATTSFGAGGTFGVSLESVAGAAVNPAVLVADLGS